RPGRRKGKTETPLALLRQPGRLDPHQPGSPCLPEGKERAARLACGWQRPRLARVAGEFVFVFPAPLPLSRIDCHRPCIIECLFACCCLPWLCRLSGNLILLRLRE